MKKIFFSIAILCVACFAKAQNIPAYKVTDLMDRVSNKDTLYIVNFWATWCGPCVKELPEFSKLAKHYEGQPVKILLVSCDFKTDYPKKLVSFIRKKKLAHEVAWLNETDANYFIPKIDNRWQGSIPATLIINSRNDYKNFFEGMIKAEQIQVLADKQLALSR